jgi:siroheme synthase-like protein
MLTIQIKFVGITEMSPLDSPRFGYPVVLDLHGVPVLVVGGGPVAVRKVAGLVAAGAVVRLVAPVVDERLARDDVGEIRGREYQPDDLDGMRLVVTATGVTAVDASVAADARVRGIWVNAADQPADCDFILPAIARQGSVSVAVSTDGKTPALAARLRDRIATLLEPSLAALADELAAARSAIKATGASTEGVDWSTRIDRVFDAASDNAPE